MLILVASCTSSGDDFLKKDPSKVEIKLFVKSNKEVSLRNLNRTQEAKIVKRFIVEVYQLDNDQAIERKEIIYEVPASANEFERLPIYLELPPQKYNIVVWSDYVDVNSGNDLFYQTTNLTAVELIPPYQNSIYREATFGSAEIEVNKSNDPYDVKMELNHATASFKLVAIDLQDFLKEQETIASEYYVSLEYTFYYPMAFNTLKSEPSQASRGHVLATRFSINDVTKEECDITFDHIFSRPEGSTLMLNLSITDADGILINRKTGINIPYKRGYMSIARANFLIAFYFRGMGKHRGAS